MPKVTRVAATTNLTDPNATSESFLKGSAPGINAPPAVAEPPMLAKGDDEPDGVDQQQPPATPGMGAKVVPDKTPLAETTIPVPATMPAAAPAPAVIEPFTLLWSRETANEVSLDGRGTITKYGDKRSLRAVEISGAGCLIKSSWVMANGVIAEAMCFVPGVVIKDKQLVKA